MAMVDDEEILLALRARLVTLAVATTGSTALSATATGYARAAGSFITDGLRVGMEVAASGFALNGGQNNGLSVVKDLTALTLTATKTGGTVAEGAAGGRTLAVGLPSVRAWENTPLLAGQPVSGVPYVEEDYLPGAVELQTVGPGGRLESLPQYVLKFYGDAGKGSPTLYRYAKALLALFPPRQGIPLASGAGLRVRGQPAPSRGQIMEPEPGWAVITVTIPLRLETVNAL